jgi:serralysin
MRRSVSAALAVLFGAALAAGTAAASTAAAENPVAGPPYEYTTEIMHNRVIPLRQQAMITRTEHGYRYRAGGQDSRLVIKPVKGGLRFHDRGTAKFKRVARDLCRKKRVKVGVAAVCKWPAGVSTSKPLLLEVWPRLGNDYIDGSRLPAKVAMAVLGDSGNDTVRLGAGPDFFNGASGRDKAWGGAGNDWIRAGADDDEVWAGAGDDYIVAMGGSDLVDGGDGDDQIWGSDGNDKLYAGSGNDSVGCGNGTDFAEVEETDRTRQCETVQLLN